MWHFLVSHGFVNEGAALNMLVWNVEPESFHFATIFYWEHGGRD